MQNWSRRDFLKTVVGVGCALPTLGTLAPRSARGAEKRERIKIGQISTAHAHALGKLRSIVTLEEDYELVGVVEPDSERRRVLKEKFPDVRILTEGELLSTKGLKAVAVEAAVRDLVPTAQRCVAAGMHIHLDKPPGESLSAYRKVLEVAARRELTVQMGYIYRYSPAFQFCSQAVRDGWLGDIFEVDAVMSKKVGDASRKELSEYPGGSMFEIGCHVIDALITVLGKPQKVTAHVRRGKDGLADNQVAVFEYPQATAVVRSALIEVEGHQRRQFVVCGDKGTIDIRPLSQSNLRLALDRARGSYKAGYQDLSLAPPRQIGPYCDDFLDFASIIRGDKKTDFSPSHDLAVHEATLLASGLPLD